MTMNHAAVPMRKWRRDYRPYPFEIERVSLEFELHPSATIVRSKLVVKRRAGAPNDAPLVLDGGDLVTLRLSQDGRALDPAAVPRDDEGRLVLAGFGDRGVFEAEVRIDPAANRALEGLYLSNGVYCTQCEAEGFRRITWYPDRPDVMSRFDVAIIGHPDQTPVMLSNGNRMSEERLPDGRRKVRWEDPFAKPCYLFALVAGDLACHAGTFRTRSGRDVALEIWVEPKNIDRCDHALASLQRAMAWDEQRFGLEYDLDLYMIVAVSDFNMGAMENKGLNVFNAKFVLASPETATDDDYEHIEGVIAHEYFHNWTGNRVTCRDWFQLTLKEGLTVYRDQLFTADMTSPDLKRIDDVRVLRVAQFAEDAGPVAHPIRPESYIEMNNFYTATVYEKGAEVVRMYETMLGREGFRRGIDLYFARHDGQAVTCDDFRHAMADANQVDLATMERWYEQPGTPVVQASEIWHDAERRLELTLRQSNPKAPSEALPLPIPVRVAFFAPTGGHRPIRDRAGRSHEDLVLVLREREERFSFACPEGQPVVSLLRGFSAPVILVRENSDEDLARRMAFETDAFNRWDAGQVLAERVVLGFADAQSLPQEVALPPAFLEAYRRVLEDQSLDPALRAQALALPAERLLVQKRNPVRVAAIAAARRAVRGALADALRPEFSRWFEATRAKRGYSNDHAEISRRALHGTCLSYLVRGRAAADPLLAFELYERADNMTDRQLALTLLADLGGTLAERALADFYARHAGDALVIDKWFSVQALATHPRAMEQILALRSHPDFTLDNPNRARSLIAVFAMNNLALFHAPDGRGYDFVEQAVIELDQRNPQVAARLVAAFNDWRRHEPQRGGLMRAALERITQRPGLSRDVLEIASASL